MNIMYAIQIIQLWVLKCQGDVVNTIEDCMPLRNKYKNTKTILEYLSFF